MTERGGNKDFTDLQKSLDPGQLTRNFNDINNCIRAGRVDLWGEILSRVNALSNNAELADSQLNGEDRLTILDAGCGSGRAITDLSIMLGCKGLPLEGRMRFIGLDEKPQFGLNNNFGGTEDTLAEIIAGDVCEMPFADETVDVGYSFATLIYVADCLKALS